MIGKLQEENRSISIDIARVIAAVLVIAIHTHPFSGINVNIDFYISNALARMAIPFFFITSGYFFYDKYIKNNKYIILFLNKIIKVYIRWSIIYGVWSIYLLINDKQFGLVNIINLIRRFFFCGTNTILWYLPALIYSTIFCWIFVKRNRIKFLVIISVLFYVFSSMGDTLAGVVTNTYINKLIGIYNFIFDTTRNGLLFGVLFITIGILIRKYYLKINYKAIKLMILPLIVILLIEVTILKQLDIAKDYNIIYSLIFLVPVIFIFLLNLNIKINYNSKILRDLSLYMYCSHGLFMILFRKIYFFFGLDGIRFINLVNFIMVSTSTIILSFFMIKIQKYWVRKNNISEYTSGLRN